MNNEEFIESIKLHVRDAAVEDTIANLKNPPGRRVSIQEKELSNWYNNLSTESAKHINDIVAKSVHEALFGLFCVLDGARTIDDGDGRFELAYISDKRTILNNPQEIGLHDLLNA